MVCVQMTSLLGVAVYLIAMSFRGRQELYTRVVAPERETHFCYENRNLQMSDYRSRVQTIPISRKTPSSEIVSESEKTLHIAL